MVFEIISVVIFIVALMWSWISATLPVTVLAFSVALILLSGQNGKN